METDIKKIIEDTDGFIKYNNYKIVEIKDNTATLEVELTKDTNNPYGFAHGGLIFGLGDTAMGIVARMSQKKAVTLDANITYLKPGVGKKIIAKGEMIKNGAHTCFLRANIYNDKDQLIATMDSNYFYID